MTNSFEKIQKHLFDDSVPITDIQFTTHELVIRERYRNVFSYWCDKPTLSDKKIVQYIQHEYGLSKTQAYNDLFSIKILLGNVKNAAKEWQRYKLLQMVDETYALAQAKGNPIAMAAVIDKLGKYTQLDKEETEKIPYDEIVPQNFDVSDDVSILGVKRKKNLKERQTALRKKYSSTLIEDAEFQEVDDDQEE